MLPPNVSNEDITDRLRAQGVRIMNCGMNTGKESYAFNRFQVSHLPDELKPPLESIGKVDS